MGEASHVESLSGTGTIFSSLQGCVTGSVLGIGEQAMGNIPPTSKPGLGPAVFSRSALLPPEVGMAGNAGATQGGWVFLFVMRWAVMAAAILPVLARVSLAGRCCV